MGSTAAPMITNPVPYFLLATMAAMICMTSLRCDDLSGFPRRIFCRAHVWVAPAVVR